MPNFLPGDKVRLRGLGTHPSTDGWVAGVFPHMELVRQVPWYASNVSFDHGELVLFESNEQCKIGRTGWTTALVPVVVRLLTKIEDEGEPDSAT